MKKVETLVVTAEMIVTADRINTQIRESTTNHDGCAYSTAECWNKGCKPAELCPGGHQVYRNWTGGGHHHKDDDDH